MNDPVPEYGLVPPVAETTTDIFPPLQRIGSVVAVADNTAGSVMVIDATVEQLFASAIVYV